MTVRLPALCLLLVCLLPLPGRAAPAGRQVFKGWMYASSPGLNPLEHPVYDAWLIACKQSTPVAPAAKP